MKLYKIGFGSKNTRTDPSSYASLYILDKIKNYITSYIVTILHIFLFITPIKLLFKNYSSTPFLN